MIYSPEEPWLKIMVLFKISIRRGFNRHGHLHETLNILNKFILYLCTPYTIDGIRATCKYHRMCPLNQSRIALSVQNLPLITWWWLCREEAALEITSLKRIYFTLHNFGYTHSSFFGNLLKALTAKIKFKTFLWSSVALASVTGSGMCKLNVAVIRWERWL